MGVGTEHSRGAGIRIHACQLPCLVAPPLLALPLGLLQLVHAQNRPLTVYNLIPSLLHMLTLL